MDVLIIVVLSVLGFWLWARNETIKNQRRRGHVVPVFRSPTRLSKSKASSVPAQMFFKLDSYTGNRKLSERLVEQVAEFNPHKSPQWWVEKAIWDIERDRT